MSTPTPPRTRPLAVTPRLAVTTRGAENATSRPPADAPTGVPTILLVDDDPSLRALLASFLRHAGYRVLEARDGTDAVAVLDGARAVVDLLVTDVVMPNTGGPALVANLRARQPDMRVLYVSGYTVDTVPADAATPDTAHLPKPLTRSALLGQVARLLGAPGQASPSA